MSSFTLRRYAFSISAAAALLGGCGGSQPPMAAPPAVRQAPSKAAYAEPSASRTLPGTSDDLIYVTTLVGAKIYSYPRGKRAGTLKMFAYDNGEVCSDREGDVFFTYGHYVLEYKHGGKKPIQSLGYSGYYATDCASDPATGNLAVTWYAETTSGTGSGLVAVYQNASGNPATYTYPNMIPNFCGYDDKSNLFCDGITTYGDQFMFAELPNGGDSLEGVSLDQSVGFGYSVQWDGKYLTVQDANVNEIYRFAISGSSGTLKGTVDLKLTGSQYAVRPTLIVGKKVLEPTIGIVYTTQPYGYVNYYKYPEGGSPVKTITIGDDTAPFGLAVSLAPSK